jgi:hypothetical protein
MDEFIAWSGRGVNEICGHLRRRLEASADYANWHRFPAGGETLTEARRHREGNERWPGLTLLPMILPSMILLLFPSAGGQSHVFTYFRSSAVVFPLIGSWRLAGGFGLRETAHSRLNLGSARRSNPTHFFRFALICVIRGPDPHIHTAEDCRGYNSMQAGGETLTGARRHREGRAGTLTSKLRPLPKS